MSIPSKNSAQPFGWRSFVTALIALTTAVSCSVQAQSLVLQRLNSQLDQPVFATYAPGAPNRLYIVEKKGAIRVLNLTTGNLNSVNFIDVPNVSFGGDERGLLGLAFHPNFQSNGYFYVNFTDTSGGDTRVVRYTATNLNRAETSTEFNIIEIDQPQFTHNGGWLGFDSSGYLYISVGDGGSSDDNGPGHTPGIGNAQDTTNNLLGKILRIDVDNDDFPADAEKNYAIPASNPFSGSANDDEIFAYGLRNPWRCSFDRETDDLYIADVGQNRREEVNVIPGAGSGGQNFGWRLREGLIPTPGSVGGNPPAGAIDPIYDYEHGSGAFEGFSITGGYVYRGPIAALVGHYFFGDYVTGNLWSIRYDGSTPNSFDGTNFDALTHWQDVTSTNGGEAANFSAFAEDQAGNLYILDFNDGEIFRVEDGGFQSTPGTFGGNVAISVNNGDLRVRGENNTDQCIVVSATGIPGQYRFSSLQEEGATSTTFNGQPALTVNGVTDDMRFDLRSGRKVLVLTNDMAERFVVPDDIRISSTGNKAAIVVFDSLDVGGRTDVTTRNGDDAVLIEDCEFAERLRVSTGNGNDAISDGLMEMGSLCNDDLDIRPSGGDDDVVCRGTVVMDRTNIRMGNGNDGTAIEECLFGPTRIYGNGGFDRYGAQNNVMASLQLRQYENDSASIGSIIDELESHPTYQEAVMFLTIFGAD